MTLLGLSGFAYRPPEETPERDGVRLDLRGRVLDRIFRVAAGLVPAAGVALVLGLFDLLKHEPEQGFGLMRQWGPWWVIALTAIYFVWEIARRVVDYLGRLAASAYTVSTALERLAGKDDRQIQEIQTLAAYNSSQGNLIIRRLDRQDRSMARIMAALKIRTTGLDDDGEDHGERVAS